MHFALFAMFRQVDLACRMAHLMFDFVTYTGGPSYLLMRFLTKYSTICIGRCARVKAVLENRVHLLTTEPEPNAWVLPLENTRDVDFCIVGVIDSVDRLAHSSASGRHVISATYTLLPCPVPGFNILHNLRPVQYLPCRETSRQ
jgi:hypothetical protein